MKQYDKHIPDSELATYVRELEERVEELMYKNPIPSAMVYFDEKQRRAVLCLDKSLPPPAVVEACTNSDERGFHTHTWSSLGWVTEAAFVHDRRHAKGLASAFIKDAMMSIIAIRDDFDRMQHERNAAWQINDKLQGAVRNSIGAMKQAMLFVTFEEERLKLARAMTSAENSILLRTEEGEPS